MPTLKLIRNATFDNNRTHSTLMISTAQETKEYKKRTNICPNKTYHKNGKMAIIDLI